MNAMQASSGSPRRRNALGALAGFCGSLLVHLLVLTGLRWAGTIPAIDFELARPNEVEFGITDEVAAPEPAPQATPPAPPSETAPPAEFAAAPAPPKPKPRPKPKPQQIDAGTPDEKGHSADAQRSRSSAGKGERPLLSAFAPEGAQIALRLHMGRVRDSELAPDVRALLDAIADFRLLLDGSGLDPLNDLERLYLASPDLRRTHLVVAGQYLGGEEVAERAVSNLAAARGLAAEWTRHGALRVAPWHDLDETDRVLALIAPHQFAISRSDDLERVLQVARALARRRAQAKKASRGRDDPEEDVGAALLALEPDETLALSVEGVRLFARGNLQGIPERLEASVRMLPNGSLDVQARAHFPDEDGAKRAESYWERTRARFADHPLVAFIGMRAPLASAVLQTEGSELQARTQVSAQQARVVLGFIRNAVAPPPPQPALDGSYKPAEPKRLSPPGP
jgi:hypothetical protein